MNFAVAATTLAVVFAAELPDKSALASLILGTRYRPAFVFAGVAVAFAVHVVLALVAGGLLALLPHRVVSRSSRRCSGSAPSCWCLAAAKRTRSTGQPPTHRRRSCGSP